MWLRDSDHTVEELTDRLLEMKSRIRDWEAEFDVESPNQLRATIRTGGVYNVTAFECTI